MEIKDKERVEIEYWKILSEESPDSDSLPNIINKMTDAQFFLLPPNF